MTDATALVNELTRQFQANDVDGGKATLTKLKVRTRQRLCRRLFISHQSQILHTSLIVHLNNATFE